MQNKDELHAVRENVCELCSLASALSKRLSDHINGKQVFAFLFHTWNPCSCIQKAHKLLENFARMDDVDFACMDTSSLESLIKNMSYQKGVLVYIKAFAELYKELKKSGASVSCILQEKVSEVRNTCDAQYLFIDKPTCARDFLDILLKNLRVLYVCGKLSLAGVHISSEHLTYLHNKDNAYEACFHDNECLMGRCASDEQVRYHMQWSKDEDQYIKKLKNAHVMARAMASYTTGIREIAPLSQNTTVVYTQGERGLDCQRSRSCWQTDDDVFRALCYSAQYAQQQVVQERETGQVEASPSLIDMRCALSSILSTTTDESTVPSSQQCHLVAINLCNFIVNNDIIELINESITVILTRMLSNGTGLHNHVYDIVNSRNTQCEGTDACTIQDIGDQIDFLTMISCIESCSRHPLEYSMKQFYTVGVCNFEVDHTKDGPGVWFDCAGLTDIGEMLEESQNSTNILSTLDSDKQLEVLKTHAGIMLTFIKDVTHYVEALYGAALCSMSTPEFYNIKQDADNITKKTELLLKRLHILLDASITSYALLLYLNKKKCIGRKLITNGENVVSCMTLIVGHVTFLYEAVSAYTYTVCEPVIRKMREYDAHCSVEAIGHCLSFCMRMRLKHGWLRTTGFLEEVVDILDSICTMYNDENSEVARTMRFYVDEKSLQENGSTHDYNHIRSYVNIFHASNFIDRLYEQSITTDTSAFERNEMYASFTHALENPKPYGTLERSRDVYGTACDGDTPPTLWGYLKLHGKLNGVWGCLTTQGTIVAKGARFLQQTFSKNAAQSERENGDCLFWRNVFKNFFNHLEDKQGKEGSNVCDAPRRSLYDERSYIRVLCHACKILRMCCADTVEFAQARARIVAMYNRSVDIFRVLPLDIKVSQQELQKELQDDLEFINKKLHAHALPALQSLIGDMLIQVSFLFPIRPSGKGVQDRFLCNLDTLFGLMCSDATPDLEDDTSRKRLLIRDDSASSLRVNAQCANGFFRRQYEQRMRIVQYLQRLAGEQMLLPPAMDRNTREQAAMQDAEGEERASRTSLNAACNALCKKLNTPKNEIMGNEDPNTMFEHLVRRVRTRKCNDNTEHYIRMLLNLKTNFIQEVENKRNELQDCVEISFDYWKNKIKQKTDFGNVPEVFCWEMKHIASPLIRILPVLCVAEGHLRTTKRELRELIKRSLNFLNKHKGNYSTCSETNRNDCMKYFKSLVFMRIFIAVIIYEVAHVYKATYANVGSGEDATHRAYERLQSIESLQVSMQKLLEVVGITTGDLPSTDKLSEQLTRKWHNIESETPANECAAAAWSRMQNERIIDDGYEYFIHYLRDIMFVGLGFMGTRDVHLNTEASKVCTTWCNTALRMFPTEEAQLREHYSALRHTHDLLTQWHQTMCIVQQLACAREPSCVLKDMAQKSPSSSSTDTSSCIMQDKFLYSCVQHYNCTGSFPTAQRVLPYDLVSSLGQYPLWDGQTLVRQPLKNWLRSTEKLCHLDEDVSAFCVSDQSFREDWARIFADVCYIGHNSLHDMDVYDPLLLIHCGGDLRTSIENRLRALDIAKASLMHMPRAPFSFSTPMNIQSRCTYRALFEDVGDVGSRFIQENGADKTDGMQHYQSVPRVEFTPIFDVEGHTQHAYLEDVATQIVPCDAVHMQYFSKSISVMETNNSNNARIINDRTRKLRPVIIYPSAFSS